MKSIRAASVASLVAALFACACGEGAMPPDSAWEAHDMMPAASPAPPPTPGVLRRSAVRELVAEGLGVFLQRVELDVDHPVFQDGRFHGFRILALRGDPHFWRGVDIHPGDVVTRVNGLPIERPEEAMAAFESLEASSELRVAFDRDGQPRELVMPIVDDVPRASTASGAPAPAPAPPKR